MNLSKCAEYCHPINIIDVKFKMNRDRFTLLELLVVLSVIMILASLLLPLLGKAKQEGNRLVCVNNQKQLYMGIVAYSADNGEWLPTCSSYPQWWWKLAGNNTYIRVEGGYSFNYTAPFKKNGVFSCPSEKYLDKDWDNSSPYSWQGSHYGINCYLTEYPTASTSWAGWCPDRFSTIKDSPSLVYLLGDCTTPSSSHGPYIPDFKYRHRNGVNITFLDGHIEWKSLLNIRPASSDTVSWQLGR